MLSSGGRLCHIRDLRPVHCNVRGNGSCTEITTVTVVLELLPPGRPVIMDQDFNKPACIGKMEFEAMAVNARFQSLLGQVILPGNKGPSAEA